MSGRTTATDRDGVPRRVTARALMLGFAAGVLSVLVFHQGTVWLLHMAGQLPNGPYSLRPIPPFGVPQIVNQCFWGGLWGILIAVLLRRLRVPDLLFGALFGAMGYAATRGRRDFTSTSQIIASRYDVMCNPARAEEARAHLARFSLRG